MTEPLDIQLERLVVREIRSHSRNTQARHMIREIWKQVLYEYLCEIEDFSLEEILTCDDKTIRKLGQVFRNLSKSTQSLTS